MLNLRVKLIGISFSKSSRIW